jgi:hypothetical protein
MLEGFSSFSAVIAAILASATAAFLAFYTYPRQKELDRQFKLDDEKRAALQAFFAM